MVFDSCGQKYERYDQNVRDKLDGKLKTSIEHIVADRFRSVERSSAGADNPQKYMQQPTPNAGYLSGNLYYSRLCGRSSA